MVKDFFSIASVCYIFEPQFSMQIKTIDVKHIERNFGVKARV